MAKNDSLVIIPTYNEKDNIEILLNQVLNLCRVNVDVLVIDDNSPDRTADLVKEIQNRYPKRIYLIERSGKLGLGTAYITGFLWALKKEYQFIIQMDADFSHKPKYLEHMIKKACKYDLVLGSRYVSGGKIKGWGLLRKIISRGGSFYSRIMLKLPFKDLTGGFKCFNRHVLENIALDAVKSSGYCFQIEMTYRTWLGGFKICEVPIVFEDRARGKSKMSGNIFLEALVRVLALRKLRKNNNNKANFFVETK